MKRFFCTCLLLLAACSKKSSAPSSPGSGSLLSKEVETYYTASGSVLESISSTYQYGSGNQLSETQQVDTTSFLGVTEITELTYQFSYAGSLVSSLKGTFVETDGTASATTQISVTFRSAGGQITGYTQVTTVTSGTPFIPPTQATGNDSATLTYDASGNPSVYTIYQKNAVTGIYQLLTSYTYSYGGGNLLGFVEPVYVGGVQQSTVTETLEYTSRPGAGPYYSIPGVPIQTANALSQSTLVTTGIDAQTVVTAYTTTYNTANQPVSASATISVTPASSTAPASETVSYTYQ